MTGLSVLLVMATVAAVTFAAFGRRWRLPCQPRLVPIRGRRRRSADAEFTIELVLVAAACLALSFFGMVLMLLAMRYVPR